MSKFTHTSIPKNVLKTFGFAVLTMGQFLIAETVAACPPGIPGGGNPSCVPPDVFYGSMQNASSAPNRSSAPVSSRPIPGMPRNVYIPHASVVMWVDNNGDAQYSAAVALHSITFSMSMDGCRARNGGSGENCKQVFDYQAAALAAIKASDGGFYFATGVDKSEAQKKGLEACAKRTNVTCKVDKVYG